MTGADDGQAEDRDDQTRSAVVTAFSYSPFAIDSGTGGTVYMWVCDGCEGSNIQLGELAVVQAGNAHLGKRHARTASYNTGLEEWNGDPPPWPPEPDVTFGVTAQPWYEVASVDELGVPDSFLWRCNLDWAWGLAYTEEGAQRATDKHVRHYHR